MMLEELGANAVFVEGGQLPRMIDKAEAVLLKEIAGGGDPWFVRAGCLTRIVEGTAQRVTVPHCIERLTRSVAWMRFDGRSKKPIPVNCPGDVAASYLARLQWRLPPLKAIVSAPTLRPDGSVLQAPGYDEATGIFYRETTKFPAVPESPTREDALAALAEIKVVFGEFPYEKPCYAAGALAALLTPIGRGAFSTAPLFAFSAPRAGSGKSLQIEVISSVVRGQSASMMSAGSDEDEIRKRIFSLLLGGSPLCVIDNVTEPLEGDALCSVLTQPVYVDRILGVSETREVSTEGATWFASGNNLVLGGDLPRRTILVAIDAKVEKPEERSFRIPNLVAYAREHRARLVVAGLTLLRAYVVAGKPKQDLPPLGGFEAWSDLVRSALVWLGEADPCEGSARLADVSPVREDLLPLLMAWRDTFNEAPWTVTEALASDRCPPGQERTFESTPLEAVAASIVGLDRKGRVDARALGRFVAQHEGRVEGGLRFVRDGSHGGRAKWRVEKAA